MNWTNTDDPRWAYAQPWSEDIERLLDRPDDVRVLLRVVVERLALLEAEREILKPMLVNQEHLLQLIQEKRETQRPAERGLDGPQADQVD